jgi:MFS superfamily sulfate permease-like transporter
MNQQHPEGSRLFDTLAFGLVAVGICHGAPFAMAWAVNGRPAAGYAFFGLFAVVCLAAMVVSWRGER